MIPKLTKGAVRAAMATFDADLRGSKEWLGWEQNQAHKYAIEQAGRLYPVKQIVSLASGIPVSKFSGGVGAGQANAAAKEADLQIVTLHTRNPDWTRDELIIALDLYLRHRPSPPAKNSKEVLDLSDLLNRIGTKLHGAAPLRLTRPKRHPFELDGRCLGEGDTCDHITSHHGQENACDLT